MPTLITVDQFTELTSQFVLESVSGYESVNAYITPESSILKAVLANDLAHEFGSECCLFRLLEWGVWPSAEINGLYSAIGRAAGLDRDVYSQAVDVIGPNEAEYLAQLAAVSMCMCYEFVIAIPSLNTSVFYSHDDFIYGWPMGSRGDDFVREFSRRAELDRFLGFREVEE